MASGIVRPIAQTGRLVAREFRFSPDGNRIALTEESNGGVFIVDVPNGIPERLTAAGRFAFWIDDEEVATTDDKPLGGYSYRVRISSGDSTQIRIVNSRLDEGYGNVLKTVVPETDRTFGHQLKRLPGGGIDPSDPVDVFTLNLRTGAFEIIANNALNPEYVRGGFLMYQIGGDDGELVWRPLDPESGRLLDQPKNVFSAGERPIWSEYFVDDQGDLLFVDTDRHAYEAHHLWEANLESGHVEQIPVHPPGSGIPMSPVYSPSGISISYTAGTLGGMGDIFIYDSARQQEIQYTYGDSSGVPQFTPDGRSLVIITGDQQRPNLTQIPVDNIAGSTVLKRDAALAVFSDDGRLMSYVGGVVSGGRPRLYLEDRTSGNSRVVDSLTTLPFMADFSHDGRYLVYMDQPSEQASFVIRAVDGPQRTIIPGITGKSPKWSPDGSYLYYIDNNVVNRLPVQTQPSFSVRGAPEQLLTGLHVLNFDVSPDGARMVVSADLVEFVGSEEASLVRVVWLQNWSDELTRQSGR